MSGGICRDASHRGTLAEATGQAGDFASFCAQTEDPHVDVVLSDVIEKITRALVNAVNLLNPQAILVGHNGTHLPARYLEQMERELNRRKFSQDYLKIRVKNLALAWILPFMEAVASRYVQLLNMDE